jgi:WD40 repeat protein
MNAASNGGRAMRGRRRVNTILVAMAFAALMVDHPRAQEPGGLPTEPMLRIESKGHIAQIWRIAVDKDERFAVTASADETARVWSLPDGRLLQVLRVPSDYGNEGAADGVAMSPDGNTVAVGGWTSPSGLSTNIYLFDRSSGVIKQRLRDLPNIVDHLAYSKDGRLLVAALWAGGIRVFDNSDNFKPLPSDSQYGDQSYWADFARDGRLVTASDDGFIRLYAPGHYDVPLKKVKNGLISKPYSAVFSQDGTRVAVGDDEKASVVVLSGSDLSELYAPDVSGIADGSVSSVGWSEDGRFLFAGGKNRQYLVSRWEDAGRGRRTEIGIKNTLMQFVPLHDGQTLFAETRGFGLIDQSGRVRRLQDLVHLDWRGGSDFLRVSSDGKAVQIDATDPVRAVRFALADRLVSFNPVPNSSLQAPITDAPGIKIADWNASSRPTVNGKPLQLSNGERSQSIAIVPGVQQFVLGADWHLHLFDTNGQNVWSDDVPTPGVAWGVNVAPDRGLVVVAFGDGTIRWRRLSDGHEILALFIHPDGKRWVAWTPQGYYDASAGADDFVGWQVNRGYDHAPDFFPASQFREQFYRPDVIARVLDTLDPEAAVRATDQAAGRKTVKAAPVASLLTPVVKIIDPAEGSAEEQQPELAFTYSARMATPDPIDHVTVMVDNAKVEATDKELLIQGDTRVGKVQFKLPHRQDSTISVIAYNKNGASAPASIRVLWREPGIEEKPKLYVLAIGIGKYRDKDFAKTYPLHYTSKDATDFVTAAKAQEGGLYSQVITHAPGGSLRDEAATREAILDELDWIKHAVTSSDVAMIMISGHGIKSPDQHYRLLPYDYDPGRMERTTITDVELQQYLGNMAGKTLFFFDTCYSAGILGARGSDFQPDVDKFANELRAAENGVVVFTSSTGSQLSLENDEWKNGVFTKAVVEGFGGRAARPQLNVISIADLESYVYHRVHDLTKGVQTPTTAKPKTVEDFWIAAVRQ